MLSFGRNTFRVVQTSSRNRLFLASKREFSSSKATNQPASMIAGGGAAVGILAMLFLGSGGSSSKVDKTAIVEPPIEVVTEVVDLSPVGEQEFKVVIEDNSCREDLDKLIERLDALEEEVLTYRASRQNKAFVFVKPHAVTDKVCSLVKGGLEDAGIQIEQEGVIPHSEIDSKKLIDNHYGAIASKAVLLNPSELVVPEKGQKDFEKIFGESWESAVKEGKVYNAAQACEKLGITGTEMDEKWSKLSRGENLIKFGGGFYCGKVDGIYVINGFYMSMREKYCASPAKIQYYAVRWNPNKLSWSDFRNVVLGATDPKEAATGSLRKKIFENWVDLDLKEEPNVGDNGVHASASPFEAMAERTIWLEKDLKDEDIAKVLMKRGVAENTIREWMKDAQVKHSSGTGSIFDFLEDLDTDEVLSNLRDVE